MVEKVVVSTEDAVFPTATTAASPSVRAAVVRLVAAAVKARTTVRSGATGSGDAVHVKRGARIATVEISSNRNDETP